MNTSDWFRKQLDNCSNPSRYHLMVDVLHFVGAGTIYLSVIIFLGTNQLYKTARYKSTIKLRDVYLFWDRGVYSVVWRYNHLYKTVQQNRWSKHSFSFPNPRKWAPLCLWLSAAILDNSTIIFTFLRHVWDTHEIKNFGLEKTLFLSMWSTISLHCILAAIMIPIGPTKCRFTECHCENWDIYEQLPAGSVTSKYGCKPTGIQQIFQFNKQGGGGGLLMSDGVICEGSISTILPKKQCMRSPQRHSIEHLHCSAKTHIGTWHNQGRPE